MRKSGHSGQCEPRDRAGRLAAALVAIELLALGGCTPLEPPAISPLMPPQMSVDSVALDLIFVHVPDTQQPLVAEIWNEVDEQVIDAGVRERLHQNGFRAGLTGATIPRALERLLGDQLGPSKQEDPTVVENLEPRELCVRLRHLQLRANQRSENVISGVQQSWPMLVRERGEVSGRTFHQAQGILALRVKPQGDGRALLELTPELHHGEPRRQYVAGDGSWLLDSGRPREVFDQMQITAMLSCGEMLLVGPQQNMRGSLGQRFFTLGDGTTITTPSERLFLVRLAQTQRDNRFEELPSASETIDSDLTLHTSPD